MKKSISYRDKLLDLAKIYNIYEVKNYIKNKKYLTTGQLELILKKNKVPVPTELNKNILQIHSKKITKPFNQVGSATSNFIKSIIAGFSNSIFYIIKNLKKLIISCVNGVVNFLSWIGRTTINILNQAYNFKVEEKKANKFVTYSVSFVIISLVSLGAYQSKDYFFQNENLTFKTDIKKKDIAPKIKDTKKTVESKETNKSTEQKIVVKPKNKKLTKKPAKKEPDLKKQKSVKEFVLPDLNLKTETVLSLFADVEYDLKEVRKDKLVKPIYFTQFPKDLDEIKNVQLKKETFIKIVLPLVVAENQKILDDRFKLEKITSKKITTDKEKSWLRQKFKEYKVGKLEVLELEKRMDIIPVSIAIAQAAKESGWGTSRFALEGNAIFGQWTWNGRGIEPLNRNKELSHKILRFPILRASVKAYKNNLNTHKSYKKFREKRYSLREKNRSIKGIKLIHTLDSYAQTGGEYTKILEQMMLQNSLEDFENVKLTNTVIRRELNL